MTTQHLADAQAREQALDPQRSFIVQAPAGSGKTGLLTQRFLRLLSLVDYPEELVAITFTRKAAAEMKNRILEALHAALAPFPDDGHAFAQHTWQLGQQALLRDHVKKWKLLDNPGRLRIFTIDAFCANLTRQSPLLSGLGGRFGVTEQAQELYQLAARATLEEGKENQRWSPSIACLLDHLDNHFLNAENLLAKMLSRRDQWLRYVGGKHPDSRALLENTVRQVVIEILQTVDQQLTDTEKRELWQLAGFAGEILRPTETASDITACSSDHPFPAPQPEKLPVWRGLTDLLLTNEGTWRKTQTINTGFPPASQGKSAPEKKLFQERKAQITALLHDFSSRETLRQALVLIRTLPHPQYTSEQWHILKALLDLLPMAVAQLHLQFQALGKVDFSEISMRAIQAMGEADRPTNLALKLDYQIRHLLIDEFQDTSQSQYRLLERLTEEWDGVDGRTLFLVGDPMQSIYRFREADVGLFLKIRQETIGKIRLIPLTLTVNFRSQAHLVTWINTTFEEIFPKTESKDLGAVPFSPSVAFQPPQDGPAVTVHPFFGKDQEAEAEQVVNVVLQIKNSANPGNIALLVRARSHLNRILPALSRAGLRYQGIDIEPLAKSMVIQDLLSLTRALTYPADRIAWLALLRAPWCGLTLADLHVLAQETLQNPAMPTFWDAIRTDHGEKPLSQDGQHRLNRIKGCLTEALLERRRCNAFPGTHSLRFWVEKTWQALGGPATLPSEHDLVDAQKFFDLLASVEHGGELADFPQFCRRVADLYAATDSEAGSDLLIMTIHKAKGLEFDTVILPGLGHMSRAEPKSLLAWMEHPAGLLLGPIKRSDQENDDPIHALIRDREKYKNSFESGRLLYVAATRARKRLHLLGHIDDKGESSKPASGSFLKLLWNEYSEEKGISPYFRTANRPEEPKTTNIPIASPPLLRRLSMAWLPPNPPPAFRENRPLVPEAGEPILFEWAGETVRLVGIVVHRFLHTIAHEGIAHWTEQRIIDRQPAFSAHLDRLGVPKEQLKDAVNWVKNALIKTLADDRGRWILDNDRHREAHSEFALTGVIGKTLHRMVLDRTFMDRDGVRWIVDFKTSLHRGGNLDEFLDNEQIRYQDQMFRYGSLVNRLHQNRTDSPLFLGLYFPMHSGWRAWAFPFPHR